MSAEFACAVEAAVRHLLDKEYTQKRIEKEPKLGMECIEHPWWYVREDNVPELRALLQILVPDTRVIDSGTLLIAKDKGNYTTLLYGTNGSRGGTRKFWDFDLFEITNLRRV